MAKIHWVSLPNVSEDKRQANAAVIQALGPPKHVGTGRLAIVGSGPSIKDHIEELQNWDGEIWAVNGTINWCLDNGINAWFYTVDATPFDKWPYPLSRVTKAALAPDIDPGIVDYLMKNGARVTVTVRPESGPTSANASDFLSIESGYRPITYFGCEGSFEWNDTHAFKSNPIQDWMIVEIGGEEYRTKAEFISQSVMLCNTINTFPTVYSEKSGGMLSAMLKHGPDHDVVMVSNTLYAKLTDKEAA